MRQAIQDWWQRPFSLLMVIVAQFILLTFIAMLFYPGGRGDDPTTQGYSFVNNFFSELGLTETYSGGPNTISAFLFWLAATVSGIGIILFFIAFPRFFTGSTRSKIMAGLGTFFGIISGAGFVGIAFTPANLLLAAHLIAVQVAFLLLLFAALFYMPLVFAHPDFPQRYGFIFMGFCILLAGYVYLLFGDLQLEPARSRMVQVVGQKIIVYAGIITVIVQCYGAIQVQKVMEIRDKQ